MRNTSVDNTLMINFNIIYNGTHGYDAVGRIQYKFCSTPAEKA